MNHISALRPTTRLAVQSVAALLVIEILRACLNLPRSNWASLAALSVLCQTWGESLRKSGQRILATVIGLTVGVLLHEPLAMHIHLELILMIAFLFLATYYSVVSYSRSIFFMSIMLALMFAVTGASLEEMYWQRILATLVGGAVALAISMTVLPTRTRETLLNGMKAYLEQVSTAYQQGVEWLLHPETPQPADWPVARRKHFTRLQQQYTTYLNEAAIRRAPANELKNWMSRLDALHLYQCNFEHVILGNRRNPEVQAFREELMTVSDRMVEALKELAGTLDHSDPQTPENIEINMRAALQLKIRTRGNDPSCRRGDLLNFLPTFYFSWKMDQQCLALMDVRHNSHHRST